MYRNIKEGIMIKLRDDLKTQGRLDFYKNRVMIIKEVLPNRVRVITYDNDVEFYIDYEEIGDIITLDDNFKNGDRIMDMFGRLGTFIRSDGETFIKYDNGKRDIFYNDCRITKIKSEEKIHKDEKLKFSGLPNLAKETKETKDRVDKLEKIAKYIKNK